MKIHRTVFATSSFVGFHRWPEASGSRAYLASEHRHLFGVTAEIEVGHDDREVEFHDIATALDRIPPGTFDTDRGGYDLGRSSCEDIAVNFAQVLNDDYPGRRITITVTEDNECGARLTFTPERNMA